MQEYYLKPKHANVKSFYNKAVVKVLDEDRNVKRLYSYGVHVASVNDKMRSHVVLGWFSSTTAKHINEFLIQEGFVKLSKRQMENFI